MELLRIALCMALLALAAGCAGTKKDAPDAPLAIFYKKGGFAGFDTKLVVRDDGRLILTDQKTGKTTETTADPATMARLRTVLNSGDLAAAKDLYPPPEGADLMTHTMEVTTPRGKRTITTTDTADQPKIVDDLVTVLNELWAQARTAPPP